MTLALTTSLGSYGFCQGNELVNEKITSGSLNGVVHYDELHDKDHLLEGVTVAICDRSFSSCSTVAVADKSGRFSIARKGKHNIYYLRFLSLGWDEERIAISLKRGAAPLDIQLNIGT
jgi:hypothetical protein